VDHLHVQGLLDPHLARVTYPDRFDLRDEGRMPSVKDQGHFPTCWLFAAMGALESCQLPQTRWDFSEWYLNRIHGFDIGVEDGGTAAMVMATLLRRNGPVREHEAPYPTGSTPTDIDENLLPAMHLSEAIVLPQRRNGLDNQTVKHFLMTHGAIDFAMTFLFDNSLNTQTYAYYSNSTTGQNHRLCMVGWDDHYPAGNFSRTPPGDGAFLVRNSWGAGWGLQGYCWVSYFEPSLQDLTCYTTLEGRMDHPSVYQHDPLGRTQNWGWQTTWGANRFVARSDETLAAIGTYTNDGNTRGTIRILTGGNTPGESSLQWEQPFQVIYPGFHTLELEQTVDLEAGTPFFVAVCWDNPSYGTSAPVENPVRNWASGADANPLESFFSPDGISWSDLTTALPRSNLCIKAYTRTPERTVSLRISPHALRSWTQRGQDGQILRATAPADGQPGRIVLEFIPPLPYPPQKLGEASFGPEGLEQTWIHQSLATAGTYRITRYTAHNVPCGQAEQSLP